jgi:hypothetical protein
MWVPAPSVPWKREGWGRDSEDPGQASAYFCCIKGGLPLPEMPWNSITPVGDSHSFYDKSRPWSTCTFGTVPPPSNSPRSDLGLWSGPRSVS